MWTLFHFVPVLVTLIEERWVWGVAGCFNSQVTAMLPFFAESVFTALLSVRRADSVFRPGRERGTPGTVTWVRAGTWGGALLATLTDVVLAEEFQYYPAILECAPKEWKFNYCSYK